MLDEPMPGAALEAPATFHFLPVLLWPRLSVVVGYPGTTRWVALYLSGDQAMYYDGDGTGTGDTSLLLAFKRHPLIAPQVAGAHLGSGDEEASEWLLVDRQECALYLAESEEARHFLAARWLRSAASLKFTQTELAQLLEDDWREESLPSDWHDRLAETLRQGVGPPAKNTHQE